GDARDAVGLRDRRPAPGGGRRLRRGGDRARAAARLRARRDGDALRAGALRGDEEECRARAEEAISRGLADGVGWAVVMGRLAIAELELGLGNPAEAI